MVKKHSRRRQKLYKMKGCSNKKLRKHRTRKHLGGTAYPNKGPPAISQNFLNPQQGGSCGCGLPFFSGGMRVGGCNGSCGLKGGASGNIGSQWTPASSGWPGVDGIPGNRNFLSENSQNSYEFPKNIGANRPFITGGKKNKRSKKYRQKGGNLSNFLGQDLINLGRQFQFGVGSAYDALSGYSAPVNPLPWKGQLINTPSLNTIKASI